MNLHEYQAKAFFGDYGLPVPEGHIATCADEAETIARELGKVVVKAQILAGGRGAAGGIKLAVTPDDARRAADSLIGSFLVTKQTAGEGRPVQLILVEQAITVTKELYAAVTLDRSRSCPVLIVSPSGGMDIEIVAVDTPDLILRLPINPIYGLTDFQGRQAAKFLGFSGKSIHVCVRLLQSLYRLYDEMDASLAEINPLAVTDGGDILALDAKLNFDANAMYRQSELKKLADQEEKDPLEQEAEKFGLNYIRLDGDIGVMVNGAGLAMATMDLIKGAGAAPANFLDVGGGAGVEKIAAGFRIILADSNVRAILINIFGGILRCDLLAKGIIAAARETGVRVPIFVRMKGTNAEDGRRILEDSGLELHVAETLEEVGNFISELSIECDEKSRERRNEHLC